MRRFTAQMSAGGRVTVPAPLRASLKLRPGTTLVFRENDRGEIHLLAEPASPAEADSLLRLPSIAASARRGAVPAAAGADPIGDWLVAEDERTKSGP